MEKVFFHVWVSGITVTSGALVEQKIYLQARQYLVTSTTVTTAAYCILEF
jgi:hypothetical protein